MGAAREEPRPGKGAYIAVDLGAGSGRVILGCLAGDALELTELHRFTQPVATEGGHERWVFDRLFAEILRGLEEAGRQTLVDPAEIRSVGVDSWGVDFGLVDEVLRFKQRVLGHCHNRDVEMELTND